MSSVRPPAVAGRFYPAQPDTLRDMVSALMDAVDVPDDDRLCPAYVVPHAGYRFSGPTAAHVYARLRRHAGQVRRIVLIGPAHFVRLAGCAVPTVDSLDTPLGPLPLDRTGRDALVAAGLAVADDEPHAPEHSLEVQLPFLRQILAAGHAGAAGGHRADAAGEGGGAAGGDVCQPGTVLLCSTDLSHYRDDPSAREQDAATISAVEDRAPDRIGTRDACGVFALRGLTALAARIDWTPRLLDYATSADTAGTPDRVVGYAAFAFAA